MPAANSKHRSPNIPPGNPKDVESIDAIVTAAYDEISGPPGKQRNWDRERSLFLPGARLIPTAKAGGDALADLAPQMLDVEGFIARAEPILKNGFFEKEIARQTEQFGQIAHVWSTYESRRSEHDREPFMRGINSIQLFHDGTRWWIVSIFWQHESRQTRIPDKYLTSL